MTLSIIKEYHDKVCCCCSAVPSCICLCNLWTVAHQAPLSVEFSRQGYWRGLPSPAPGIEPPSLASPALAGGFFTTSAIWEDHDKFEANQFFKICLKLIIFWEITSPQLIEEVEKSLFPLEHHCWVQKFLPYNSWFPKLLTINHVFSSLRCSWGSDQLPGIISQAYVWETYIQKWSIWRQKFYTEYILLAMRASKLNFWGHL